MLREDVPPQPLLARPQPLDPRALPLSQPAGQWRIGLVVVMSLLGMVKVRGQSRAPRPAPCPCLLPLLGSHPIKTSLKYEQYQLNVNSVFCLMTRTAIKMTDGHELLWLLPEPCIMPCFLFSVYEWIFWTGGIFTLQVCINQYAGYFTATIARASADVSNVEILRTFLHFKVDILKVLQILFSTNIEISAKAKFSLQKQIFTERHTARDERTVNY